MLSPIASIMISLEPLKLKTDEQNLIICVPAIYVQHMTSVSMNTIIL